MKRWKKALNIVLVISLITASFSTYGGGVRTANAMEAEEAPTAIEIEESTEGINSNETQGLDKDDNNSDINEDGTKSEDSEIIDVIDGVEKDEEKKTDSEEVDNAIINDDEDEKDKEGTSLLEDEENTENVESTDNADDAEIDRVFTDAETVTEVTTDDMNLPEDDAAVEIDGESTTVTNTPFMALRPLTEVKAYLVLNGKTEDDLKNMSLDTVLSSLVDANGDSISIPEGADSVWRYVKDDIDGIEEYEKYSIGAGAKIDLSTAQNILDYQLELIIGSGNQLNPNNIRYMITVYVSEKLNEEFTFELYTQPTSNERVRVEPQRKEFAITESTITSGNGVKIPNWGYVFIVDEGDYRNPYLGATSKLNVRPDITLKIYELSDYLNNSNPTEITDELLGQDMSELNAGYRMSENGANFAVEYYLNNVQADIVIVTFLVTGGASKLTGGLYTEEDGQKVVVSKKANYSFSMEDETQETYTFELKPGYLDSDEYFCSLNAINSVNENVNDKIIKAVDGYFDSLEDAQGAADISAQLFSENGYKAVYGGAGKTFTVFFEDEAYGTGLSVFHVTINAKADEDVLRSYTDEPIIGSKDPWFRVVGAENTDGSTIPTNIVENGKSINMDTMYGYGYQTVFINDPSISTIIPVIEKADSDTARIDRIYVDGHEYDEGDTIELTGNETTKMFNTVIVDENGGEHTKNYNVSFVKVASGPKLYVVDPKGGNEDDPVRSVFLDEYFEYKHDILIANIGDEELTGLRVELNATNVKLDDYWTVGGEGTDTLAPVDPNAASLSDSMELPNIAKIRLLPDGVQGGDIEGTLTVYADGQDPVIIKLSGRAQNPFITTDAELEAVKYVPYSYMITTNNMYDWNTVEFSYTGEIPDGMEFNVNTGEIYGAPLQAGNYTFTVKATYGRGDYFKPSTKEITIKVLDNENETVFNTSDDEYKIIPEEDGDNGYVGEQVSAYDFVITSFDEDEVFISEGEYGQFVKLWLNGEVLTEGVDYTKEPGSTRIIINAESLEDKTNEGRNTISAEFNIDEERGEKLKRTSQNFRVELASKEEENKPASTAEENKPASTARPANQNNDEETTDTEEQDADTVNIITHVVGADDKALANYIIEMHSTVKTANTDASGNASFESMEMGQHTVYIKNEKGTTVASKNFTLKSGSSLSRDGDTITIVPGETVLMTIKVEGSKASIVNVKSANSSFTGDTVNTQLWIILIMMSMLALSSTIAFRKHHS